MGYQIVQQPGTDLFAILSSEIGAFVATEATREEVVQFFVDLAADAARERVERILGFVETGDPERIYGNSTLTWEEATAIDRRQAPDIL